MPPQIAPPEQRLPATMIAAPHPAVLPVATLSRRCDTRRQARSGPGGQHRNRTASGVFLTHRPTGVSAEASERRSQHDNARVAMGRLRMALAIAVRTPTPLDADVTDEAENAIRGKYRGGPLRIAATNPDLPAVVALLLNDLHAAAGQPSLVAPQWKTSTSRIVQRIRHTPAAWTWLQRARQHHGRPPLK